MQSSCEFIKDMFPFQAAAFFGLRNLYLSISNSWLPSLSLGNVKSKFAWVKKRNKLTIATSDKFGWKKGKA